LPVLFFPYARTLWMALDLTVDRDTDEHHLTGEEIGRKPE
jgi:hypothetical protein